MSDQLPWFVDMNPNGRIPVLVDHSHQDFPIFESAAILLYLEQHYDKKKRFSVDSIKNPKEYSSMLQWIFFSVRFYNGFDTACCQPMISTSSMLE
jgi:glutathione S-transferase